MDRPTYVSRMLRIVLLLSIDLVVEMTADSIHWLLHIQLNLVRQMPPPFLPLATLYLPYPG